MLILGAALQYSKAVKASVSQQYAKLSVSKQQTFNTCIGALKFYHD
jgi:hypothetical protein